MKINRFLIAGLLAVATLAAAVTDFVLPSATGGPEFKLSEQRGKFVALHFLLKTECPDCLRHTNDYSERASELPDVVQVFIKPDEPKIIREWVASLPEERRDKIQIYHDKDAQLAKTFGIRDGYKFHGETVHYPALVLINPKGEEVFRYIGSSNTDRYSFDKLKAKIGGLSGK